uniref:Uncharacterized protein n=1 Tax=Oryza punctata TaxID=4537 RepID=A0A0E0LMZ7_ORYPU
MQALLGSVTLAHVDRRRLRGAHLLHGATIHDPSLAASSAAAGYPDMQDYVNRFAAKYPEIEIKLKEVVGEGVRVKADTSKLVDLGFKYKYEQI